jgi:putative hydrolase of the HAD superfamily
VAWSAAWASPGHVRLGRSVRPAADPLWGRMQAGEITEPGYRASRAAEVSAVTGEPGVRAMMRFLYPMDEIETHLRKEAYDTLARAKAAGLRTAVLANDLVMFLDPETIARIRFLAQVDAVMDGSAAGIYKPDPLA